ncbi:MAG: FeoC-like transcriptional regulator [Roseburia sp.]
MTEKKLFEDYKVCDSCGRPLPFNYKEATCPGCKELALFHEVREYIRANDVTEYDVAEHFSIPLTLVKKWIREGRIEYKEESTPTIKSTHCLHCGAQVTFGTICPKCLKQMNASGYSASVSKDAANRMRFLENV